MEARKLIDNSKYGEITAYIGSFSIEGEKILPVNINNDMTVLEHFSLLCNREKLIKALPILNIKENVVNLKMKELSGSLKNKLAIIESLVSKENVFVFDNINKHLSNREAENVKRILKKLAEHEKKVIVISNDLEFLFGLTKTVCAINEGEIINLSPINWFNQEIYKFVSKPPIIEFIMNCKKRNIKIEDCYETKELLKAIYRSVDR